MPRLEPIWQKYREQGLSIVAIDTAQRGKSALKFIEEKKLTYHFLETHLGPDDPVTAVFSAAYVPINMVVDAEGRVLFLHSGYVEGDEAKLEKMARIALDLEP